jgi:hypothetical protein
MVMAAILGVLVSIAEMAAIAKMAAIAVAKVSNAIPLESSLKLSGNGVAVL